MFECSELHKLRDDYKYLRTPKEREIQLQIIHVHRETCVVCNGEYQTAGLKQLYEQAYAGTWGNGER
jgi:uncharacterized protein YdeI (YjbR/CyaY-like superfamily)